MAPTEQPCPRCGADAPRYRDKSSPTGLDRICKNCRCEATNTSHKRARRRARAVANAPTFESIALTISGWAGEYEKDLIPFTEFLTRVLRLLRETKCVQKPDLRLGALRKEGKNHAV